MNISKPVLQIVQEAGKYQLHFSAKAAKHGAIKDSALP